MFKNTFWDSVHMLPQRFNALGQRLGQLNVMFYMKYWHHKTGRGKGETHNLKISLYHTKNPSWRFLCR